VHSCQSLTSVLRMSERLRVLVADDHLEFQQGLCALLGTDPDIEVVGIAHNGTEATAMAGTLQPDVVLMDLNMPEVNGVQATRAINSSSPHIRILVLTMLDSDDSIGAAIRAGARGYLLKGARRTDVLRAIHSVASGEMILAPGVANRLVQSLAQPPEIEAASFPELSPREAEILDLIAAGVNNTEISEALFLSPKTVRNHITSIFSKLNVDDRSQAIVLARGRGAGRSGTANP
jgi:DNA-binding NarL/FixJ family response regulator